MNKPKFQLHRTHCGCTALAAAVAFTALIGTSQLHASDHIDSPSTTQDRGSDLTDTYAFLDPNDNSQVILIMSTQGF
ncbi:MAG: DUF4331 family protein, partial [Chthoniobacterales bacterium]|nr:DUF4331 family protein [Chthoniobacterales bacterium]